MYVNIDGSFLDKSRKEASKEAITSMGDVGKNFLIYPELKDEFDELNFEEDRIEVMITNELGSFSFTIPMDTMALEQILTVTIKKMNKIKTMLESLK